MAEKLEIVVQARDQASAVLKGVAANLRSEVQAVQAGAKGLAGAGDQMAAGTVSGFGRMKAAVGQYRGEIAMAATAVTAFAAGAMIAFKGMVSAALENAHAQERLSAAIAATGQAIDSAKLISLARHLQEVTRFSDEETEAMMAVLIAMGFNEDQVIKLTPRIQNLAAVMDKDLGTAARLVGVSIQKNLPTMTRFGVVLDKDAWASASFDEKLLLLDAHSKGVAETMGKGSDAFAIMKNQLDEVKESIGLALLPALKDVVPVIITMAKVVQRVAETPLGKTLIIAAAGATTLAGALAAPIAAVLGLYAAYLKLTAMQVASARAGAAAAGAAVGGAAAAAGAAGAATVTTTTAAGLRYALPPAAGAAGVGVAAPAAGAVAAAGGLGLRSVLGGAIGKVAGVIGLALAAREAGRQAGEIFRPLEQRVLIKARIATGESPAAARAAVLGQTAVKPVAQAKQIAPPLAIQVPEIEGAEAEEPELREALAELPQQLLNLPPGQQAEARDLLADLKDEKKRQGALTKLLSLGARVEATPPTYTPAMIAAHPELAGYQRADRRLPFGRLGMEQALEIGYPDWRLKQEPTQPLIIPQEIRGYGGRATAASIGIGAAAGPLRVTGIRHIGADRYELVLEVRAVSAPGVIDDQVSDWIEDARYAIGVG